MHDHEPRPGDGVRVEYVPFAKSISRIEGTTCNEAGYGTVFVLLFPLVGTLLLVFTIRAHLRRKRAFRDGTPASATVTYNGLDRSTRINGRNPAMIRWSFADPQGKTYTGSLSNMEPSVFFGYPVESQITVLYLPDDPKTNTLWVE